MKRARKAGKKICSGCFLLLVLFSNSFAQAKTKNVYEQELANFFKTLNLLRLNDFSQTKTFILPEVERLEKPAIITEEEKTDNGSYLNNLVDRLLRQEETEKRKK